MNLFLRLMAWRPAHPLYWTRYQIQFEARRGYFAGERWWDEIQRGLDVDDLPVPRGGSGESGYSATDAADIDRMTEQAINRRFNDHQVRTWNTNTGEGLEQLPVPVLAIGQLGVDIGLDVIYIGTITGNTPHNPTHINDRSKQRGEHPAT